MNTAEALATVIDIASRWGENAEEALALPRRLTGNESDVELKEMLLGARPSRTEEDLDKSEIEEAIEIRNLWKAIDVLNKREPKDAPPQQ